MSTDKSVQNQKVFVTLASVLQLQAEYLKVRDQEGSAATDITNAEHAATRAAMENIIIVLGLPIQIAVTPRKEGPGYGKQ